MATAACGNDDDPKMPSNAIALNMTTGDDGTTIGNTDVYINNSLNFASTYCDIADLGKNGSMTKNPTFTQIAREVAVTPGNFYQITRDRDMGTVASLRALSYRSGYYNVYVDSWIYDKANEIVGARINYAQCTPEIKQLPVWDAAIELKLSPMKNDENVEVTEYSFAKGCVIDEDITAYRVENSSLAEHLEAEVNGNRISFSNSSWSPAGKAEVIVLVRYESVYTRVIFNVKSSM